MFCRKSNLQAMILDVYLRFPSRVFKERLGISRLLILACKKRGIGFPDSSVGKESTCNAGYPGLIPGLGRSPGEGIGYPLQYSWVSLVTQLVKNPPAMPET